MVVALHIRLHVCRDTFCPNIKKTSIKIFTIEDRLSRFPIRDILKRCARKKNLSTSHRVVVTVRIHGNQECARSKTITITINSVTTVTVTYRYDSDWVFAWSMKIASDFVKSIFSSGACKFTESQMFLFRSSFPLNSVLKLSE